MPELNALRVRWLSAPDISATPVGVRRLVAAVLPIGPPEPVAVSAQPGDSGRDRVCRCGHIPPMALRLRQVTCWRNYSTLQVGQEPDVSDRRVMPCQQPNG